MIFLNRGIFKPILVLFSFVFLPIVACCLVLTVKSFRLELLVVTVLLFLVYCVSIYVGYRLSMSSGNIWKFEKTAPYT